MKIELTTTKRTKSTSVGKHSPPKKYKLTLLKRKHFGKVKWYRNLCAKRKLWSECSLSGVIRGQGRTAFLSLSYIYITWGEVSFDVGWGYGRGWWWVVGGLLPLGLLLWRFASQSMRYDIRCIVITFPPLAQFTADSRALFILPSIFEVVFIISVVYKQNAIKCL